MIYNKNGIKNFITSLNQLKQTHDRVLNINVWGDSISLGAYAGGTSAQWAEQGYIGQLRNYMGSIFQDVGNGFRHSFYYWTKDANWTINREGFGIYSHSYSTTTPNSTASLAFMGTSFELTMKNGPDMGTLTVTIDSDTPIPIDCSNDTEVLYTTTLTGLTNTNHTITLTKVDTKEICLIGGIGRGRTYGVNINNFSISGIHFSDMDPKGWNTIPYFSANIDLAIIAHLTNEGATTDTVYKSNMQSMIDIAKENNSDILLIAPGIQSAIFNRVNILYELADENNIALLDVYRAWGGTSTKLPSSKFMHDGAHPNQQGHNDIFGRLLLSIYGRNKLNRTSVNRSSINRGRVNR